MLDEKTGECRDPLTELEMAMAFKEVTDKFEKDHKVGQRQKPFKQGPVFTNPCFIHNLQNGPNKLVRLFVRIFFLLFYKRH